LEGIDTEGAEAAGEKKEPSLSKTLKKPGDQERGGGAPENFERVARISVGKRKEHETVEWEKLHWRYLPQSHFREKIPPGMW